MIPQEKHPMYDADKSWKGVRTMFKDALVLAAEIQRDSASVVLNMNKLADLLPKIYVAIPKTDVRLMVDSPIFPAKVIINLYRFMARLDGKENRFAWLAKAHPIDIYKAPDFVDTIKDALAWALKFESKDVQKLI